MSDHWLDDAACAGHPRPQLWDYKIEDEPPDLRALRIRTAVAICKGCSVRRECAQSREPWAAGIYGGRMHGPTGRYAPTVVLREITHGTEAGAKAHKRRGESPCRACLDAANRASVDRARRGVA